jgi:hypothetical protein
MHLLCAALLGAGVTLSAQTPAQSNVRPVEARSSSTFRYAVKDGQPNAEITNVAFEITGDSVPGRPPNSRLLLRTTMHSVEAIGDKGVDATVTLEAWPLGTDLQQKPLYNVKVPALSARTVDSGLWLVDRDVESDSNWWSVYQVGSGKHLFDTDVELVRFSISRESWTQRYAALKGQSDDTSDSRLKDTRAIALIIYASAGKVIRDAVITCDNPARARDLRSYADASKALTLIEPSPGHQALRAVFDANFPSPSKPVSISIPILKDDLDLAHAELPAGFHVR